jgi:hypothetical protein
VVVADLLTGSTSVLRGNIDHDHVGRRDGLGQFDRRADHLQLAVLAEQQAHPDFQHLAPGHQGHTLRHVPPHSSLPVNDAAG